MKKVLRVLILKGKKQLRTINVLGEEEATKQATKSKLVNNVRRTYAEPSTRLRQVCWRVHVQLRRGAMFGESVLLMCEQVGGATEFGRSKWFCSRSHT